MHSPVQIKPIKAVQISDRNNPLRSSSRRTPTRRTTEEAKIQNTKCPPNKNHFVHNGFAPLTSSASLRPALQLQELLNVSLNGVRCSGAGVALHGLSLAVDQELREVPLHRRRAQKPRRGGLQEVIHGGLFISIDIHFAHDRERRLEARAGKRCDFLNERTGGLPSSKTTFIRASG